MVMKENPLLIVLVNSLIGFGFISLLWMMMFFVAKIRDRLQTK